MRYAVLSDIHGNVDALRAVLKDISLKSIDTILCLGDVVGYYPDPEECVKLIKENAQHCLAGNHDYAAIGLVDTRMFTYYAYVAMEWTKKNLSDEAKAFLRSLPLTLEVDGMFLAHASPCKSDEWAYVFPDSELAVFEAFNSLVYRLNFIGHTHWPSIMIQEDDKIILHTHPQINIQDDRYYLVNVGSVGQSRDRDPRSCYAIYDTVARKVTLERVDYDITQTQRKIVEKNLPLFLAQRLEKGQ